jgi:drug/metabolite transporter (DMT)-like permease
VPRVGEILAIGSALAWALTSVVMRPIVGQALWRSSVLRMVVCAALLAIYAAPSGALDTILHAPAETWLWLLGSTLCSIVVGDTLYFLAAARLGVARALPIASSFPLLTTLGAIALLNEPPTVPLLLGSLLVVLAVGLIGGERAPGGGRADPLGLLLAGLAACMWAGSGLFLGPALRSLDTTSGNVVRFSMASLLFGAYVLLARPRERLTAHLVWLSLLAAVGTLASALMFLSGIAGAGVARAVALNATSPVFSAILATVLLRERMSRRAAVGIAASVVGTVLLAL